MDGMTSNSFKSKCCNKQVVRYRADDYPYDSGWECPGCGTQWSELQIKRGEHLNKKRGDKK
jgi:hypothetical protein